MQNFNLETETSGKYVVDFWAEWCAPCRQLAPMFEEISEQSYLIERGLKFYKSNIDNDPDTAQKWGVRSIPTLILFKDGKEVERIIGVQPKNKLIEKFVEFVNH